MAQKKRLSAEEISLFCQQTAMILRAGIPLVDGMQTLCHGAAGGRHGKAYETLYAELLASGSLCRGMERSELFPAYAVSMAQVGETTGRLDTVMGALADYYEREQAIAAAARRAVVYPAVLILLLTAVVTVLILGVVPVFRQVYRSLGLDPAVSLGAATTVGAVLMGLLILLSAAAAVVTLLMGTRHRAGVVAFLCRVFPPVRRAVLDLSAARFCAAVAVMLASGSTTADAIQAACRTASGGLVRFEDSFEGAASGGFAPAMRRTGAFDELHCRMAEVGEAVGSLDTVMESLGRIYSERSEESLSRLVSLIEPTLVAALSIVVGGVMLSVLLPLLQVLSALGL